MFKHRSTWTAYSRPLPYLIVGQFSMTMRWDVFFSNVGFCFYFMSAMAGCWGRGGWRGGVPNTAKESHENSWSHRLAVISATSTGARTADTQDTPASSLGPWRIQWTLWAMSLEKSALPRPSAGCVGLWRASTHPGTRSLTCGRKPWRLETR